ncbi:MAG: DNA-binding protein [Sulfurospirillaceae bacterium]|nr:DNA-binding protein [Sulfurospirillaceae bacterium]MDD2827707.1 DNA-binding protein [Sulfurospirillaceae bacterium]
MTNTSAPQQKMRVKHIVNEFPTSPASIWLYAKQGKLTPIKVTAGVTVFDRKEVEAFFSGKSKMEVSQ